MHPDASPDPGVPPEAGEGRLFGSIFTTDELLEATSDRAWVAAMLEFEAALALAEAETGVVPPEAAAEIAEACSRLRPDPGTLGRAARASGNPAVPLVAELAKAVGERASPYVHHGATSQDVLDTASMLVAQRAGRLVLRSLVAAGDAAASLAEAHGTTLLVARTLLQPALPTTFALKAAGWLDALTDSRDLLSGTLDRRLAAELGGAAGTLASLGSAGPATASALARRLGLSEPRLPWHAARGRVAELACALALVTGVAGKISLDVELLMQFEVAEAAEPAAPGRGASSTLPHKRNPVAAAAVGAAARRAGALAGTLLTALPHEHERAVGAWHAEWEQLSELLRLSGGAADHLATTLSGLEVDTARMRANLDATGGILLAERIVLRLAPILGRRPARDAVERAVRAARSLPPVQAGGPANRLDAAGFAEALRQEPAIAGALSAEEVEELLDPAGYLGSAGVFVGRALDAWSAPGALTPGQEAPGGGRAR